MDGKDRDVNLREDNPTEAADYPADVRGKPSPPGPTGVRQRQKVQQQPGDAAVKPCLRIQFLALKQRPGG